MGGLILAWLAGESLVVYRWAKLKAPPTPGALAWPGVLFVGLAVIGEYAPARTAVTLAAWGLDLAVLLQVIGKKPDVKTHWPPPLVTNPAVVIPTGHVAKTIPKSQV